MQTIGTLAPVERISMATAVVPAGYQRTIKHSRFAFSIGSRRIAFERVQDRYTMLSALPGEARPLPGKLLFGIATAGLFLAYVALLPSPSPASHYSAELVIPEKATTPVLRQVPIAPIQHTSRHVAAAKPAPVEPAGEAPTPAAGIAVTTTTINASLDQPASSDIVDVPSDAGERSLAVLGPARKVGGKMCRDVQIFSRDAEGKVSVEPVTRCGKP